jgi:hypothetical protein
MQTLSVVVASAADLDSVVASADSSPDLVATAAPDDARPDTVDHPRRRKRRKPGRPPRPKGKPRPRIPLPNGDEAVSRNRRLMCLTGGAWPAFDEFEQRFMSLLDHGVPFASLRLPEQPSCWVPRAVVTIKQPTPISDILQ